MAIQKLNNRRLLNKDEEDEKKSSSGLFMLPTYEELAVMEKAKEDAAKVASSENTDLRSAIKTFVEREGRLPDIAPGQTVSRSEAPLPTVKKTENNRVLTGLTNLGAGFVSGTTSAAQGAENIVKDVFTAGEQGEQINSIERYLGEHASERDTLMRSASYDEDRAVAKIAKSAGVSESAVRDYKKNNYASYIKQSNDAWADENDLGTVEKFLLGDAAYQVGQQLPGMMLGAAGQFSQGGTLIDSVKDAVTAAKGTGAANMVKAIGEGTVKGILNAAKGNLTTNLMALNTAGSNYFQNQQQYGDQRRVVSNLVDSAAQGFLEQFTEHIGGFTDIGSVGTFLDSRSGSTAKTLAKTILKAGLGMFEEGAEEVINAPLGNIVKKITFEPDKAWFGEGGVFDIREMAKAGATGALLGGLMGGVGTVAAIADVVMPANKSLTGNVLAIEANAQNFNPAEIRAAVDVLNRTAEEYGVAPIADSRAATIEDVQNTSAAILDAVRERAEGIKANDPAATETAQDTFVKHDIAVTDDGKMYVTASRNVITGQNTDEQRAQITQFFKELLQNKPSLDIQTVEGDVLTLTMGETANKARDNYKQISGNRSPMTDDEFKVKLHVESHMDEIAEISKSDGRQTRTDEKNHPFAKDGFTYRTAYFRDFDGQYYQVKLSVGHNGTTATVYNVGKIKESVPPSANLIAVVGSQPRGDSLSDNSISQSVGNVNRKITGTETAQDTFAHLRDKNPDFGEIERTGRVSGAQDDDIRMAGELSSALGKKIRFFRQEAKGGFVNNGEYHEGDGTIWINAASKNVKAQIVAHELTHSIEQSGAYKQLVNLTMEKLKGEGKNLDELYRQKEMQYAEGGVRLASYEEITSELVAEFVETRLLTDEASIKSLVQENRTLGQRIREWFDSLLAKMGNASAKERDYIRQMRDVYAEALGEDVSAETTMDDKVQHSFVGVNEDGIEVYETSDEVKKLPWKQKTEKYLEAVRKTYRGKTIKFERNGHVYYAEFDRKNAGKAIYGDSRSTKAGVNALVNAGAEGDVFSILENSRYDGSKVNTKDHTKADYFDYYLKTVEIDGKQFDVIADIEKNYNRDGGYVYTLSLRNHKKAEASSAETERNKRDHFNADNASVDNSISQNGGNVKGQNAGNTPHSISRVTEDTEGRKLSEGQQEYFRDSKVVDENGRLKVMYHGTSGDGFTVFDKKKARSSGTFGNGFYFSDSKSHAGQYGTAMEVYLDIKNPLTGKTKDITDEQMRDFIEAVADDEDYGIENYGYSATVESVSASMRNKTDFEALMDINITCIGNMAEALKLFNEVNGTNYDGIITPMETVVFEPEQIKNVDNQNPTKNPDIRYSVSKVDDTAVEEDPLAGVSSAVDTEVEELDVDSRVDDGYTVSVPDDIGTQKTDKKTTKQSAGKAGSKSEFTRADAMERYEARKKKREERKTVAKAETAFKRLGYDIEGAIVDNYEDAAGIIEDNRLAAQTTFDINRYIKANNISPRIDTAAKLIATDAVKPTAKDTGISGSQLKMAKELAELYRQQREITQNSIREQGKKNTDIVNNRLDQIFSGFDWFTDPGKAVKRLRHQLQLSLSNPEQVMRDVFGAGAVSEELNEYIIRPTIENSARARRQTNQMVANLRKYNLNESESGLTQIFSEYSNLEESGSKKVAMSQADLRAVLMGQLSADVVASRIEQQEYSERNAKDAKEFHDSIVEQFENAINVNRSRARQRALREYKAQGGTGASWNAMSKEERQAKIDAAYKTVTDESVGRITEATKELRHLLDDMFEAINAISVIHGAEPITFRRGYMPHSHRQTEELQKWFNDHMGGLNVTPVQDLPTDIAGKTADRKPNKRWFSHAQERTGPRTTWDALGNIEDYLSIANDTIYHMDDIRKMRVLERYIRGIYSVARGATGEEQRTRVKNDVMSRLHGTDDDLVFFGLKQPERKPINDEDMDLSQMTTFVTWLTDYANDLAAKQIFNRDIERFAGRQMNNIANTLTSWSSRVMMQYNISSNLKQLSQLGSVSGDVGVRISKDAAALTLRSMRKLGNGTNDLEQKYHISERSTFLTEKEAIEEATFASDKDLTAKQKSDRQHTKDIWDYAWSFTDTTMSRYTVYAYFLEGMNRGMDDTAALRYADTKARNILASRMKGSSPLIFEAKNPILRMFTLFQREPLAAWQDVLKTMPREYAEMKNIKGEKTAKEQMAKRVTGRLLGTGIVNTVYATVLGLGTPAMFDILGEPIRALFDKLWREITPDEDDDITWEEMAERFVSGLGDEIADDIPFANVISLISNTYAGTEFESRLALNAPDIKKIFGLLGLGSKAAWNGAQMLWSDDAEDIELMEEIAEIPGQIPQTILDMLTEIVGTAAPAGNQLRKSAKGLIAVLRSGEYTKDGQLKYEVGGVGESIRAILLGSSNTRAGQEWIASGFDSLSKTETEAYKTLIDAGVSEKKARQYVERVAEAEKIADETHAQAEGRLIDGMSDLTKVQKAELYYDMVATDSQISGIDAAVDAGADIADAVETARAIRDASKKRDKLNALLASDMDTDAKEAMYLSMVATKVKDADGNVIGTEDDELLDTLYATGLDFDDFLDAKQMQSQLNADESLSANQRASRFLAWTASQGYTNEQADVIGENFGFASGFRVKSETYQKIVDGGVTPDNAVKVTDALTGASRSIDKINAIRSTGIIGDQLDRAIKAVLEDKAYEKYRIVIDANIPLSVYTWVLDNADLDAEGEKGHGSINNTERLAILQKLALSREELSALWLATGGSEKSNPYKGLGINLPKIEMPTIEMPKIDINIPKFDFDFGG